MSETAAEPTPAATVVFLDSGVGGLPYMAAYRAASRASRLVYVADRANFPYGEKSADEVSQRIADVVSRVISRIGPAVIVIACNTASVTALAHLRARFCIPFVGVVPAVKPAALVTGNRRIGVLATQRTVDDPYVADLIRRFADGCHVQLVPAPDLIDRIESGTIDGADLDGILEQPVRSLHAARVDTVVLGCTHFVHIEAAISRALGDGIRVVDSVDGVVRQTSRVLENVSPPNPTNVQTLSVDSLFITGVDDRTERLYRGFSSAFSLHFSGAL